MVWLTSFLLEAKQSSFSSTFVLSPSEVFQGLQQDHDGMFQLLVGGSLQVNQTYVT